MDNDSKILLAWVASQCFDSQFGLQNMPHTTTDIDGYMSRQKINRSRSTAKDEVAGVTMHCITADHPVTKQPITLLCFFAANETSQNRSLHPNDVHRAHMHAITHARDSGLECVRWSDDDETFVHLGIKTKTPVCRLGLCKCLKIHRNTLHRFNAVRRSLDVYLKETKPTRVPYPGRAVNTTDLNNHRNHDVICCGFDEGGMVATVAAAVHRCDLITFASPRVGNGRFASIVEERCNLILRVVHNADPVDTVHMPPWYVHAGRDTFIGSVPPMGEWLCNVGGLMSQHTSFQELVNLLQPNILKYDDDNDDDHPYGGGPTDEMYIPSSSPPPSPPAQPMPPTMPAIPEHGGGGPINTIRSPRTNPFSS